MTPLDWHPIVSAPKDGSPVDVYSTQHHTRWCDVIWDALSEEWVKLDLGTQEIQAVPFRPTHWMRVPPPIGVRHEL